MKGKMIEIVVMWFTAGLFFVFAYLLGVKKKMELIAGYNKNTAKHVKDKDGLARFIARVCLSIGLASLVMPVVTHFTKNNCNLFYLAIGHYGGFILGVIILCMFQSQDYVMSRKEKKEYDKN